MRPVPLSRKASFRGGGVALIRTIPAISKLKADNDDQMAGIRIVMRALESPLRMIVENSGHESGSVVVAKVHEGNGNFGYNAATDKFGDMIKDGVLDPTKVTRSSLQNAASIASLVLTTDAVVAETPKKEAPMPPMPDGGMGGMGNVGPRL